MTWSRLTRRLVEPLSLPVYAVEITLVVIEVSVRFGKPQLGLQMSDEQKTYRQAENIREKKRPDVALFDPWDKHFVSQNGRSDFQKALESSVRDEF